MMALEDVGLEPIDAVTRLADRIETVSIDKLHGPGQLAMLLGDQVFGMERGKRPNMGSIVAIARQLDYAQDIASRWRA